MKTAIYHQPAHLQDRELFVAQEHDDGTVDLHDSEGNPVVTNCPVVEEKKEGACTISSTKTSQQKPVKK